MTREREHILITGGAGFVGSNLADALLRDGERVIVADNFSRAGVEQNAAWLRQRHGKQVRIETADVRDAERVRLLVGEAKQVFHLAAQVAVTTSLEDPMLDLQTNVLGTFHVLEAAHAMRRPPAVLFTSTNKVYGGLDHVPVELAGSEYRYGDGRRGITEAEPLDFHSPYGCSKGAADQYVRDYARIFGVPTTVFRMSCIYGTRQSGTEDQGWVAHFARALFGAEPITIFGDGKQVRDILWIDDLVRAMRLAMDRIEEVSGEVFNMGGGQGNAVSVRGVVDRLREITGRDVPIRQADWRPGDQRVYVSDTSKAERVLGWRPSTPWKAGLEQLVEWLREAQLDTPVLPLRKSVGEAHAGLAVGYGSMSRPSGYVSGGANDLTRAKSAAPGQATYDPSGPRNLGSPHDSINARNSGSSGGRTSSSHPDKRLADDDRPAASLEHVEQSGHVSREVPTIVSAPGEFSSANDSADALETEFSSNPGSASSHEKTDPAPANPEPPAERRINVWIAERESDVTLPLILGEDYTLCFSVGEALRASLVQGAGTDVPDTDVPSRGLDLNWELRASGVELISIGYGCSVHEARSSSPPLWTGKFDMHVPKRGNTDVTRLKCVPRAVDAVNLCILIFSRSSSGHVELYRELAIDLHVVYPRKDGSTASQSAVQIVEDVVHAPSAQLNLYTLKPWTTPAHRLSITVLSSGTALVKGHVSDLWIDQEVEWVAVQASVSGPIVNARNALEQFRRQHDAYLNSIDVFDFESRLDRHKPEADFEGKGEPPSADALKAWNDVSLSSEMRVMAHEGKALYDAFFPVGSDLRCWMDQLEFGDRLDLTCHSRAASAYIPHIPWGLMYRWDVAEGEHVNPTGFLGLSMRLGYSAHRVPVPSKALGDPTRTHRAFLLYWGDHPADPVAAEARWQLTRWSRVANCVIVPDASNSTAPKERLLRILSAPVPVPTSLLYLYCHCVTGQGNNPELRFGNDIAPLNVLRRTEWGTTQLMDRPLVFANACTTSAADPFFANELEASFFRRGVRAYIGTEGKVPARLASRFAALFLHYFERRVTWEPIAGGEASYQAKLFLWRHYRSIGGLFYTYINQYELYMADEKEVRDLRF